MSQFYGDAIFWIEVDKIKPNPYQPRRDFDEARLRDLADSIRMYGVLQPIVVTRQEQEKEDGGLQVYYELIAGERRWRAAQLAGLTVMPATIRSNADDARMKLELAIIENLQREDLNPVDRARAFDRLVTEFHFKHHQIASKMGKSREYVSNSLRLLALPKDILDALSAGKISEGHARPILMLDGRPEEQQTLFKEIVYKKLTVRETEAIARRIAYDRVRKKQYLADPEIVAMEETLTETLGTRVQIERRENGGKLVIDFFSNDDLRHILDLMKSNQKLGATAKLDAFIARQLAKPEVAKPEPVSVKEAVAAMAEEAAVTPLETPVDDRSKVEQDEMYDEEVYSVKNFTI